LEIIHAGYYNIDTERLPRPDAIDAEPVSYADDPLHPAERSANAEEVAAIIDLNYEFDWSILFSEPYLYILVTGIKITFLIFITSSALSVLTGTAIAIFRISTVKALNAAGVLYVRIFQSIPVLFWMLFFYYFFPELLPGELKDILNSYYYYPVIASIIALTLDNASYVSDILKGGRSMIPDIQREVAIATGLTRVQQYIYVLLPQMFRVILPPLGTRLVHNFKNTTLCMAIATPELMWATQQVESITFKGVETIMAATVFYLLISVTMASAVIILERHMKIDAASIIKSRA